MRPMSSAVSSQDGTDCGVSPKDGGIVPIIGMPSTNVPLWGRQGLRLGVSTHIRALAAAYNVSVMTKERHAHRHIQRQRYW